MDTRISSLESTEFCHGPAAVSTHPEVGQSLHVDPVRLALAALEPHPVVQVIPLRKQHGGIGDLARIASNAYAPSGKE